VTGPRQPLPPIDFAGLNEVLLRTAQTYCDRWLPGGKKVVNEWVCADLSGGEGRSCSVNLKNGRWSDFASGDTGGDLISLYAAVNGINNGQAAARLMEELGIQREPLPASTSPAAPVAAPAAVQAPAQPAKRKSLWTPVVPVPPHAPVPTFQHFNRELQTLEATWEYRFDGVLYGHVARFKTSDGGKEVLPHTWCQDDGAGAGTQRWHWMQWTAPRPLYVPATLLSADPALVPVVLVEGEKCAKAGFDLLPAEYDWVTWPGGGNAWDKADWEWLQGRVVVLWPDCDAKRVALTKAEREAGVDPASKPLLPEAKQPGVKAMVRIARRLAELKCALLLVKLPKPGDVRDGWDVADAIGSGWGPEEVRAFLRSATAFTPTDEAEGAAPGGVGGPAAGEGGSTPSMAGAGGGAKPGAEPTWWDHLLWGRGGPAPVRENAVAALDGVELKDGKRLPGVAAAEGVIAYNEFTNDIVKLKPAPWGAPAGLWAEVDELLMGEWLVRRLGLASMARGTLEEAVRVVAARHSYHPVRAYLEGLTWDAVPRLATWLRKCCLEEDEWDDRDALQKYLARAGTWFLQGMVARVMEPGVKFDYMLILEGGQGLRKSTLFKTLAGDYFADTGITLGDKDSYQQLQGRWLYEFAELDSFGKAEVTKIKSFVASASDYFRASFDRRARDYPRQLVFGGSTNEDHYLTDATGNRRFWPVRVTRLIDIEWLRANRDQLFAEALMRWRKGGRMHPTPDEEKALFAPQQQQRMVTSSIGDAIAVWLESEVGCDVNEITLSGILGKIGIGVEKLGPGRYHEKQAGAALRALGWTEGGRCGPSVPGRPRKWTRPKAEEAGEAAAPAAQGTRAASSAPAVQADGSRAPQAHQPEGADHACPF
jgi:putative DNA primase/helicase